MVQFGDFSVQLVDAECKLPFTEHHHHDGKTYVEIPNGEEYFIAISKPHARLFAGTVLVRMYANGAYLGFNLTYVAATKYTTLKYKGHWKRQSGVSIDTPIKSVDDPLSKDNDATVKEANKPALGKVKIKVFPTLSDVVVPLKNEEMDRCSGTTTTEDDAIPKQGRVRYNKDCLLSTVTLYYGTRPTLIQLGVVVADPCSDCAQTNNKSTNTPSSVNPKETNKDRTAGNADSHNAPKRRSKLSRVSTKRGGGGGVKKITKCCNTTGLDPTEADDSDSDYLRPKYKVQSDLHAEDEEDDGSIVFVDPDMDVIALD